MKNVVKLLALSAMVTASSALFAQKNDESRVDSDYLQKQMTRHEILIPDVLGYQTLKCDFHIHTIFSDGIVLPTYRVEEAWQEGLDAISITDHLEKWPSKDEKINKEDANANYNMAKPVADQLGILLVKGAEITRRNPDVGHYNALFLEDCNPVRRDRAEDPEVAIKEALKQKAFIFWNHPGWDEGKTTDTTQVFARQREMIKNKMIFGMEVFNTANYYPILIKECLENNLTMLCNTDIHGIISDKYNLTGSVKFRPMTLVLSKDRSVEGLREALFAGRTVLFFNNQLIGKEEYVKAIFASSLTAQKKYENNWGGCIWEVENSSEVPYIMDINNRITTIPANCKVLIQADKDATELRGAVKNIFTNMFTNPTLAITIKK